MAKPRALTQRQIKTIKKERSETNYVTIYNNSKSQPAYIQLKSPPGVDWFRGEQTTVLPPQQQAKYPAHRLYVEQVVNHEKKGRIKILSGRQYLNISSL